MIFRDQAIVLRYAPFGNTSRVVVWLTAHHGKLATLAKGCQRPASPFLGHFDLFYTCEILFYAKEPRHWQILRECAPEKLRISLRNDWRACAAASYAADLLDRALPFGPAPPAFFELFNDTLEDLAVRTPGLAFLPRFELRLLAVLGLAPRWDRCRQCQVKLGDVSARWQADTGVLRCESCAAAHGQAVSPAALAALLRMTEPPLPPPLPERVFQEVDSIVCGLLAHHGEFSPLARSIAAEILAAGNPDRNPSPCAK